MNGYCFDTSAFMEPWNRWYPIHVFPSLWQGISDRINDGLIISPAEVRRELQGKNDTLYKWTRQHPALYVDEDDDVFAYMQDEIFSIERFANIQEAGRNGADPLVISMAALTRRTVVTNEQRVPPNSAKIKIPTICEHLGVRWLRPLEFYQEAGICI